MQKISIKDAVIKRSEGGSVFENDSVEIYPYFSQQKKCVSLVAFKKCTDEMRLLGRWHMETIEEIEGNPIIIGVKIGDTLDIRKVKDSWVLHPDDTDKLTAIRSTIMSRLRLIAA